MERIILKFKETLYPQVAIMKASYHFIDKCYVHVDYVNGEYIVEITQKDKNDISVIAFDFQNELLAQSVRYEVYKETHTVRELLLARAMSSTLTGGEKEISSIKEPEHPEMLEDILTDWFEKNER